MSAHSELRVYPLDPERCIGIVSESSAGNVKINIYPGLMAPGTTGSQAVGAIAGEFVVMAAGGQGIVGHLLEIKLVKENGSDTDSIVGVVQPLLSLDLEKRKLLQGVTSKPQVGNKVYSAHPELVQTIADLKPQNQSKASGPVMLSLGKMIHSGDVNVDHTPR